jgi:hypothetical protein
VRNKQYIKSTPNSLREVQQVVIHSVVLVLTLNSLREVGQVVVVCLFGFHLRDLMLGSAARVLIPSHIEINPKSQ